MFAIETVNDERTGLLDKTLAGSTEFCVKIKHCVVG
jgi:hypothetical protein